MSGMEDILRLVMAKHDHEAPAAPDLLRTLKAAPGLSGRRGRARSRSWYLPLAAAAAVAAVVLGSVWVGGLVRGARQAPHRSTTAVAPSSPSGRAYAVPGGGAAPVSAAGCLARRIDGPLPVWARSGFQPPDVPIGHVIGVRGDIVAILWGGPQSSLYAPPLPGRGNKVLWVPRHADQAAAPLTIRATLNGTHRAVTRELPDVGPSYVDLPAPGCWTLDLSWSGHRDQVELWYTAS